MCKCSFFCAASNTGSNATKQTIIDSQLSENLLKHTHINLHVYERTFSHLNSYQTTVDHVF